MLLTISTMTSSARLLCRQLLLNHNVASSLGVSIGLHQQLNGILLPLQAAPMQHLRHFADMPTPSDPLIVPVAKQQAVPSNLDTAERNKGPWTSVQDKASGGTYWWNQTTGVVTPVGAPQPDAWVAVRDEQSGKTYYWNQQSGDTTAVGEPMPGPEGRLVAAQHLSPAELQQAQAAGRVSAVQLLGNSLAVGFGVGLVFALIRMIF